MTQCPACKAEIPDDATVCMHCRAKMARYYPNGVKRPPTWPYWVAAGVMVVGLAGAWWNDQRLARERQEQNVCELVNGPGNC